MAQTLATGLRHVAVWGAYQIEIDDRDLLKGGETIATIRHSLAPYEVQTVKKFRCGCAPALRWAALWLESHHCGALVDGKRHPLVDFLVFVPAVGGVTP